MYIHIFILNDLYIENELKKRENTKRKIKTKLKY